jgi:hypothetical protein
MPSQRTSYRVGNDYERVPGTGARNVPSEYQLKKLTRRLPGGQGIQQYTPAIQTIDKRDLLLKLSQVRTWHVRIDIVGYLRNDARYVPEPYSGHRVYLSRNIALDIRDIYNRFLDIADVGWRVRDELNDLTGFEFGVIEEVRFVERGRSQGRPLLAKTFEADKRVGRV